MLLCFFINVFFQQSLMPYHIMLLLKTYVIICEVYRYAYVDINLQLVTLLSLSTHHPSVNWQKYPLSLKNIVTNENHRFDIVNLQKNGGSYNLQGTPFLIQIHLKAVIGLGIKTVVWTYQSGLIYNNCMTISQILCHLITHGC